VLGAPATPSAAQTAFEHGWYVIAGAALLAALAGLVLLQPARAARSSAGAPAVETG
jgi:hypothetical protein